MRNIFLEMQGYDIGKKNITTAGPVKAEWQAKRRAVPKWPRLIRGKYIPDVE